MTASASNIIRPNQSKGHLQGAEHVDTLGLMRDFLAERLDVAGDKVVPEAKLAELGVDSLMFAEMLFEFEDRAKTELDIRSADALPETVGELIAMIDAHLQAASDAASAAQQASAN